MNAIRQTLFFSCSLAAVLALSACGKKDESTPQPSDMPPPAATTPAPAPAMTPPGSSSTMIPPSGSTTPMPPATNGSASAGSGP